MIYSIDADKKPLYFDPTSRPALVPKAGETVIIVDPKNAKLIGEPLTEAV